MPARSRSNKRDSNEGAGKRRPTTRAEPWTPTTCSSLYSGPLSCAHKRRPRFSLPINGQRHFRRWINFGRLVLSARPRSSVLTPNRRMLRWFPSKQTDRPRCSRPIKGKCHPYSWMISYGLDGHLLLHGQSPNNGVHVSADDFIAWPNHLVIFHVCSTNNAVLKNGCKIKRAHRPTSLFSAQSRGQGHLHGWFRTSMIIAASCFTADWSMPSMFLDDDEVSEHKHLVPINDQRQSSSMISHDPECLTPYHRTFVDDFSRQVSRSSRSNSELY